MTRDEKIIRNKVGVLELAKQLGSVSQACRIMGFSRDSFYRFKELYEKGGEAALIEMSRRVPNPKNRVAETIERRILELVLEQPAWGHTRIANELARAGIPVSPTGDLTPTEQPLVIPPATPDCTGYPTRIHACTYATGTGRCRCRWSSATRAAA